jgi:hypothetical protein
MKSNKEIAKDMVGELKHCKTNEEFDKCLDELLKMVKQATRKATLKDVLKSLDRINNNPYETSYLDVLEYFRKWLEKEVQKK